MDIVGLTGVRVKIAGVRQHTKQERAFEGVHSTELYSGPLELCNSAGATFFHIINCLPHNPSFAA